jgi:hypothetical protein
MDGSFISPDKRYVLLDNDLADIVENADPKVFRDLMKFLAIFIVANAVVAVDHISISER